MHVRCFISKESPPSLEVKSTVSLQHRQAGAGDCVFFRNKHRPDFKTESEYILLKGPLHGLAAERQKRYTAKGDRKKEALVEKCHEGG